MLISIFFIDIELRKVNCLKIHLSELNCLQNYIPENFLKSHEYINIGE